MVAQRSEQFMQPSNDYQQRQMMPATSGNGGMPNMAQSIPSTRIPQRPPVSASSFSSQQQHSQLASSPHIPPTSYDQQQVNALVHSYSTSLQHASPTIPVPSHHHMQMQMQMPSTSQYPMINGISRQQSFNPGQQPQQQMHAGQPPASVAPLSPETQFIHQQQTFQTTAHPQGNNRQTSFNPAKPSSALASEETAERLLLHSYIYDYLYRNNLKSAAMSFLQECPDTPVQKLSSNRPPNPKNAGMNKSQTRSRNNTLTSVQESSTTANAKAENSPSKSLNSPTKDKDEALSSSSSGSPSSSTQNSPSKSTGDQADGKQNPGADGIGNSDAGSTNSSDMSASLSHFGFAGTRDNAGDTSQSEISPSGGPPHSELPEPMVEFAQEKGFLFAWWTVHWDIMMAMKHRQASHGATSFVEMRRNGNGQFSTNQARPGVSGRQPLGQAEAQQAPHFNNTGLQTGANAFPAAAMASHFQQQQPMTASQAEIQHARFAQQQAQSQLGLAHGLQQQPHLAAHPQRRSTLPTQPSPAMLQAHANQMQTLQQRPMMGTGMPASGPSQTPHSAQSNATSMQAMMHNQQQQQHLLHQHQQQQQAQAQAQAQAHAAQQQQMFAYQQQQAAQNRTPHSQMAQHAALLQRQQQNAYNESNGQALQRPPSAANRASPLSANPSQPQQVPQRQPSRAMQRIQQEHAAQNRMLQQQQQGGDLQQEGSSPSMISSPVKRPRQIPMPEPYLHMHQNQQPMPSPRPGQQSQPQPVTYGDAYAAQMREAQHAQYLRQQMQQQQQQQMSKQAQAQASSQGQGQTQSASGLEAYRQQISAGVQQQLGLQNAKVRSPPYGTPSSSSPASTADMMSAMIPVNGGNLPNGVNGQMRINPPPNPLQIGTGPLSPALRQDGLANGITNMSPRQRSQNLRQPHLPPSSIPAQQQSQVESQMPPPPLPSQQPPQSQPVINGQVTPVQAQAESPARSSSTVKTPKLNGDGATNAAAAAAANARKRPAEDQSIKGPAKKRIAAKTNTPSPPESTSSKNASGNNNNNVNDILANAPKPQPPSSDLAIFPDQNDLSFSAGNFDWQSTLSNSLQPQGVPAPSGLSDGDSTMFDLFLDSNYISWDAR